MRTARLPYAMFVALTLVATLAAACSPAATPVPPTVTAPTSAPTAMPAATTAPTAGAVQMGTADHPIVMAIAPSATSDVLIASGNKIADLLSKQTGLTIKAVVPTNYQAMIQAMCSGNGEIGYLPPFAYLVAHQTMSKDASGKSVPCADVAFVALRAGQDHYATQFIGVSGVYTPGTSLDALKQFAGKKPCWTDPLSASGYVIPASLLSQNGVKTKAAAFVQGHPTVVRAVYAGGICDFGATFVDARTDTGVQKDLPDVMQKVVVVYKTANIIPNDTIAFASDVPADLRGKLATAMDAVAKSADGSAALKSLYAIDGLKTVDDTFFDEFRVLLSSSGIDIASLVK